MGSKNEPGKFDCYAKAAPDEPMFVLLARDPHARHLVNIWACLRERSYKGAIWHLSEACEETIMSEKDKIAEARECAEWMRRWRSASILGKQR